VLGDLAAEFGLSPTAWRGMPWCEFAAWVEELGRRADAREQAARDAQQRAEIERQRRGRGY